MGSSLTIPEDDAEEQRKPGIVYKTSIYGWGKLKYPVRKNGKILVYVESLPNTSDVGFTPSTTSNHQTRSGNNIPTPPSSSRIVPQPSTTDPENKKAGYLLHQRESSREKVSPRPKNSTISISNTTASTKISNSSGPPSRFPSAGRNAVINVNTRLKQIDNNVKPTKPTSLTFYGQYRCSKCNKYWRSPHSKEGISQNCSKCGTATLPKK